MSWELIESTTTHSVFATILDPEEYFADPDLAVAIANIELALSDIDPNDTATLYERCEHILDMQNQSDL